MTEERRFDLIRKIKEEAKLKGLNLTSLYCLIATMTDDRLEEFYCEFLNIK